MVKSFLTGVTPGVESYMQENRIHRDDLHVMIETAVKHADKSYFIAFHKQMQTALVTDGNDHILDKLMIPIPETIWFVFESIDSDVTCVAMLPREY
ncbi:hypothetical protein [Lentibacillus amyloliquefaciens]|uniref:Uncharacterized protein n=1 Tax=Lentibacillus amyloliquefaciens TaxID=1472767 RepID=A0A0U4F2F9_9BACI|nr:hypothetical protein [Lentibacillus amyloliquefaciens]ALX47766.1 hypothetical protein AOX59_03575 [Lentibacillus amyloliquefaciens]